MIFSHLRWIPTPLNFLIEFGRITRTIFFNIGGATAPSCPPCRRHCHAGVCISINKLRRQE